MVTLQARGDQQQQLVAKFGTSGFLLDHLPFHVVPLELYPVAFSLAGAIIGGSLLVWLKLRFMKASDDCWLS